MSEILFNLIKNNVYKDEAIREVSENSQGYPTNWIFDFKSQGLSKFFLEEYARCFWDVFKNGYGSHIQIGGMETGAIPFIAGTSLCSPKDVNVSSFYIRKSRKRHGLSNLIEGEVRSDSPIILIDDIINGGSTMKKQIQILEDLNFKVTAIFTCLRFRDLSYYKNFTDKGIAVISIFELNDFSAVLPVHNLVTQTSQRTPSYTTDYKLTLTLKPNLYLVVPKSAPVLAGDYIYMGIDGGSFYCIRAADGSVEWVYKVMFGSKGKYIFSSPSVYKDKVIFGAYDGNVYCLNRFSGKTEWVFSDADWVGSSPCIDSARGVVYIGLEFGLFKKRGGVAAIDIQTGKVKWRNYTMPEYIHASPSYSRKYNMVICGCNDNGVYAFNAKNGEIIWRFETKAELKYGAVFDERRGLVIIAGLDGGVYLLCVKDGTLYHRFQAQFGFYATPVIKNNLIVIGSVDKIVYCFNIITKSTEWYFKTAGRIFASPLLDSDSIFIGSNDGRLYELDIYTGKLLSSTQLTERIVNKIQVTYTPEGKRVLYVLTHIGELYKLSS